MPFFKSHPADAGPPAVFTTYPEIYQHWARMGEALMNGPSPLTPGERELIAAYVVGLAECEFAYVAHSAVAYAWGIEDGLIEKLIDDLDSAPVDDRFKPLLAFVRILTLTPSQATQADADAVFDAGWDEKALHDAIAVTARMCFMQRILEGHGFTPMTPERARERAEKRVKLGYQNLYPELADSK
jgi:alkylhydroperoxidase family enzyme